MRKILTGNSQSYGQYIFVQKTMKYSRPELYANATLLSQIECCKHYISIYLDEKTDKTLTFCKKMVTKIPPTQNSTVLE